MTTQHSITKKAKKAILSHQAEREKCKQRCKQYACLAARFSWELLLVRLLIVNEKKKIKNNQRINEKSLDDPEIIEILTEAPDGVLRGLGLSDLHLKLQNRDLSPVASLKFSGGSSAFTPVQKQQSVLLDSAAYCKNRCSSASSCDSEVAALTATI